MKVDMVLRHGGGQSGSSGGQGRGQGQGQGAGRAPGGVPGPPGGGQGGDNDPEMWSFHMKYKKLPAAYAMEIASLAASFTHGIANRSGSAASDDPAYEVTFSYDAEEAMPKGIDRDSEIGKLFKGEATAVTLLYSEAIKLQRQGWKLLDQLMESAEIEVEAGQRK
jgi:hypothetical protein